MTVVGQTIDNSMASVSSLPVGLLFVLLGVCFVNGHPSCCERSGGVVEEYIKSIVRRQLEPVKEAITEVKVQLRVREEVEKELKKVTQGNYR